MLDQFSRTELLFGKEAMDKLKAARVAVFGIGGVGGYAVEALDTAVRHADILVALSAAEVAEEFAPAQRAQWASPNGWLVERVGNSLERQSRGCLTVGIGPKHRGWDMELDGMIAILQI